jgi:hypothetical protein
VKALTLHQPWATGVAEGIKTIETRSWATSYRGPLAIHAGKRDVIHGWNIGEWRTYRADRPDRPNAQPARMYHRDVGWATRPEVPVVLPFGAVVAVAVLVDVVPIVTAVGVAPDRALIDPGSERGLRWTEPMTHSAHGWLIHHCEKERRWGDFTPGRFAWILDDVRKLDEPIPAKGRQGLWDWDGAPEEARR